jgi:hypothetical protein
VGEFSWDETVRRKEVTLSEGIQVMMTKDTAGSVWEEKEVLK